MGTLGLERAVHQRQPFDSLPFTLVCIPLLWTVSIQNFFSKCGTLMMVHWQAPKNAMKRPMHRTLHCILGTSMLSSHLAIVITMAKCELNIEVFLPDIKMFNVANFYILGPPIGDAIYCAKFLALRQSNCCPSCQRWVCLIPKLHSSYIIVPPSFCKLVHLVHITPSCLVSEGLALFYVEVHCHALL